MDYVGLDWALSVTQHFSASDGLSCSNFSDTAGQILMHVGGDDVALYSGQAFTK